MKLQSARLPPPCALFEMSVGSHSEDTSYSCLPKRRGTLMDLNTYVGIIGDYVRLHFELRRKLQRTDPVALVYLQHSVQRDIIMLSSVVVAFA